MKKNKVDITIRDQKYTIISEESTAEMSALAADIDKRVSDIMDSSERISLTQALVLTSLDLADELKKNKTETEKLRNEIGDYLEDAEEAKTERDKYKRELSKLKK